MPFSFNSYHVNCFLISYLLNTIKLSTMQAITEPVVEVVINGHLLSATVEPQWVVMLIVSGVFIVPFFFENNESALYCLKKILPLCRSVFLLVGHIYLIIQSLSSEKLKTLCVKMLHWNSDEFVMSGCVPFPLYKTLGFWDEQAKIVIFQMCLAWLSYLHWRWKILSLRSTRRPSIITIILLWCNL